MSLALSTSWNAFRFSSGNKIVKRIKDLGFDEIELSFALDNPIIEDILRIAKKNDIKVISLHNFCPIPEGFSRKNALPDCYSLSSADENERKAAVLFTKRSIDCCREFKASALVIHSGRIEMEDETRSLIELYSKGLKKSPQYDRLWSRMQEDRKKEADKYFSRAIKSLNELADYAQKSDIALGIENRFYYREIPSFAELTIILSRLRNKGVFYWHDTGHAQVSENLGFVNSSADYLSRCGENLIGMHLHDVKGCRDHLAPLKGEFDFNKLKPYFNNEVLKVIEAHYPAAPQEIIEAKNYLEKILN